MSYVVARRKMCPSTTTVPLVGPGPSQHLAWLVVYKARAPHGQARAKAGASSSGQFEAGAGTTLCQRRTRMPDSGSPEIPLNVALTARSRMIESVSFRRQVMMYTYFELFIVCKKKILKVNLFRQPLMPGIIAAWQDIVA